MEISVGKRILYSLWIVPLVPVAVAATLIGLFALPSTSTPGTEGALLTIIGVLVPVSYLLGWLTSCQREERLAFLKVLTGYLACITLLILTFVLRMGQLGSWLVTLLLCIAALGAFVWAAQRRKAVMVRAALYRSPEQREARHERAEVRRRDRAEARQQAEEELVAAERAKMARGTAAPSRRRVDVTPQPAAGSALASVIGATATVDPQPVATVAEPPAEPAAQVLDGLVGAVQVAQAAPVAASKPTAQPAQAPQAAASSAPAATVDVNSCTAGELLALPGMSAGVARGIVTERDQHGPYRSFEDVVARCALKPHQVASFAALLTVPAAKTRPAGTHRARTLDL